MSPTLRGRRLLPSAIDDLASDPASRPYASVPNNDFDLSEGFHDVGYALLANAINHAAAWLDRELGNAGIDEFPPFSYEGPKDLRFPILAVAAIKTHRTILVLSPVASIEGRAHIITSTQCKTMLYAPTFDTAVKQTIQNQRDITSIQVPELSAWLTGREASPYKYDKTWEAARDDPTIIFHTSGTTGLPKPIVWTNTCMCYIDARVLLPRGTEDLPSNAGYTRLYTTTGNGPGLTSALQGTVWRGEVIVFGPSHRWPDAVLAEEVIYHGRVRSFMVTPHIIEDMVQKTSALNALRSLDLLIWTGAPLKQTTGDLLSGYTKLKASYGSTESAGFCSHVCKNPADWNYLEFQAGQGIEFSEHGPGLYELFVRRLKGEDYLQPVFAVHPNQNTWYSNDLFKPHSREKDLWSYQGRRDEFVMLSIGCGLQPSLIEPLIASHSAVEAALIGGTGHPQPFLLLQLTEEAGSCIEASLDSIWNTVEKINQEYLGDPVRLRRNKIMIANSEKPFVVSEKGTMGRASVLKLYESEIGNLYYDNSKACP